MNWKKVLTLGAIGGVLVFLAFALSARPEEKESTTPQFYDCAKQESGLLEVCRMYDPKAQKNYLVIYTWHGGLAVVPQ